MLRYEALWLLEVVVAAHPPCDGWIPLFLLPDDDPEGIGTSATFFSNHAFLNFHPHHMPLELLVAELSELFGNGDIIAADLRLAGSEPEPEHLFVPSPTAIRAVLTVGARNRWLCYTLTAQGFARWEAYAKPHWDRFRAQSGVHVDKHWRATCAATADVAVTSINRSSEQPLDWNRATFSGIRPWKVFPFKVLERGVCVVVRQMPKLSDSVTNSFLPDMKREEQLERIGPWYEHGVKTWDVDSVVS